MGSSPYANAAKRVLIAEDSPTQAVKLQYLLEQRGFVVSVARDGLEAIEHALQSPPDILISDIMMPNMNGYELARRFRSEEALSGVPIILLTTLSDAHDIIHGLESGADNFIRKPYNDDYLVQRVHYILTNKALRQRERVQMGIEIEISGHRHFITAERQQIFDLLISTYEEAVHLNKSLEHSNQSLNGLFRVAEGLNGCNSEAEVLERVLERVLELPCVAAGWIFTGDGAGGFRTTATSGVGGIPCAPDSLDRDCECKQYFASGDLTHIVNIHNCHLMAGRASADSTGGSHACISLWANDRPAAILNLANKDCRPFSEDELKILYGVGHQAGLALERARLHEQLEELVEKRTRELREKTSLLDHLLSASPTIIYMMTFREGRFYPAWTSDSILPITGWTSAESLEEKWLSDVVHPEDRPIMDAAATDLIEHGYVSTEYRIRRKDGEYIWIHDEQRLLRNAEGAAMEVVGSRIDVNARKIAEETLRRTEVQLYQAQKLESIGSLAGGIAHDMNNVLSAICGYTELVMEELPKGGPLHDDLSNVLTAGKHGAKLVRQILAFSRKQILRTEILSLNDIVRDFSKMIGRLLREDVELRNNLSPVLHNVSADAVQMEQVIMNLVINARDAMPSGGLLTLETANVELDEAYVERHPQVVPGKYVMLAVCDTGTGMDAETKKKIFEPFFTTKETGSGTGLGLATVYGIVKQHNGNIWVYSEIDRGTTFKIFLPAVIDRAVSKPTAPVKVSNAGGNERVLVVEDDEIVRKLVCDSLSGKGYRVKCAEDPERAIELMHGDGPGFDLLVTDIILPVMNGRDLFNKLKVNAPSLKVLYISGYTQDVVSRHGILDKGIIHLQKPFTIQGLLCGVREALDAPASPLN